MAIAILVVNHKLTNFPTGKNNRDMRHGLRSISNYCAAAAGGAFPVSGLQASDNATAAAGTLTLSSASGTVGGTINGTAVTVTASGGDSNTAKLIATAINNNTTVNKLVVASASGAVVTVTAVLPGYLGNCCTFVASGTGVTASGSGKLTGGTNDAVQTFSRGQK